MHFVSLTTVHVTLIDQSDHFVFPADNGLNPVYNNTIEFDVICPPMAYIRFAVYDEDMFGDPNFVAQAVFPFESLRLGYRSVPLKNAYNEDLELSSLLVFLDMFMVSSQDRYYCCCNICQLDLVLTVCTAPTQTYLKLTP